MSSHLLAIKKKSMSSYNNINTYPYNLPIVHVYRYLCYLNTSFPQNQSQI